MIDYDIGSISFIVLGWVVIAVLRSKVPKFDFEEALTLFLVFSFIFGGILLVKGKIIAVILIINALLVLATIKVRKNIAKSSNK